MSNIVPMSRAGRRLPPAADQGLVATQSEGVAAVTAPPTAGSTAHHLASLDVVLNRLRGLAGRLEVDELDGLADLLDGDTPQPEPAPKGYAAPGRPDHRRFFTDVRRLWIHSAARQRPNAILLVAVRSPASREGEVSLEELRRLARVRKALSGVFAQLTQVYAYDRDTLAMVLPGLNLREAVAIAESTRRAIHRQLTSRGSDGVLIQAGVAALHQEDDPSTAINLAVRCLEIASGSPVSKVVCETDPEARFVFRSSGQPRPRASSVG